MVSYLAHTQVMQVRFLPLQPGLSQSAVAVKERAETGSGERIKILPKRNDGSRPSNGRVANPAPTGVVV